ncbi:MAG: hypothetical protein ACJ8GN_05960 [Longimicrobiaceae bacterium]
MNLPNPVRRAWPVLVLPLLAACADRSPTLPAALPPELPAGAVGMLQCTVNVPGQEMSCTPVASAGGARGAKLLGGQEKYIKLSSSGTAYDGGTQIFSSNVSVQNLLKQSMGTTDGSTVTGVDVFFAAGPTVTSGGAGSSVTVFNYDGLGTFTATNQRYFHYAEIIETYQISAAKSWQFQISGAVSTFSFTVYVSAPLVDESTSLLDEVWEGDTSTDWQTGANWNSGVAPDSANTVSIPADSLLGPGHSLPVLSASARLTNLRVGYASTLGLGGFMLTAYGNVDAVGTVSNGTVRAAGTGAFLGGNLPAMEVTGSAQLQRSTRATGAVSVTGTLSVKDQALNISIP